MGKLMGWLVVTLAVVAFGCTQESPLSTAVLETERASQGPRAGAGSSSSGEAPMFATLDENMQPVDMADLIDGRPLVLTVGSAS